MKNKKKGFTLAELLIVVAIIAVLVAIAVPIFVSALKKAEEATIEANERTLRGMATVEILANDSLLYQDGKGGDTNAFWYVSATYSKSDDKFSKMTITPAATAGESTTPTDWGTSLVSDGVYKLYVKVTATDLDDYTKGELTSSD